MIIVAPSMCQPTNFSAHSCKYWTYQFQKLDNIQKQTSSNFHISFKGNLIVYVSNVHKHDWNIMINVPFELLRITILILRYILSRSISFLEIWTELSLRNTSFINKKCIKHDPHTLVIMIFLENIIWKQFLISIT
mgnify:CR=1 FL=1